MADLYEEILRLKKDGKESVLVTVVDKEGSGPATVGGKMLVTAAGLIAGTVGGGALEQNALLKAGEVLKEHKNFFGRYSLDNENINKGYENTGMVCGGSVSIFFEYISPGAYVYIFGAGHVGKALIQHMKNLNYYITLLDNREGIFENIEGVQRTFKIDYSDIKISEYIPQGSYIVIVTPSYNLDYAALKWAYKSDFKPGYIGMIASKKKLEMVMEKLTEDFEKELDLSALYAPIGLDIGGTTPDEIAISIIAEIQALRYGKEGHKHVGKK